jgi:hypothetical protein
LWGEFATLGFFLRKAENPVEERTKKTPYDELIHVTELVRRLLMTAEERGAETDQ